MDGWGKATSEDLRHAELLPSALPHPRTLAFLERARAEPAALVHMSYLLPAKLKASPRSELRARSPSTSSLEIYPAPCHSHGTGDLDMVHGPHWCRFETVPC